MRIVLKNSSIAFAKALFSATGRILKVTPSETTKVNFPVGVTGGVMGMNVVDLSQLKFNKIINDAGQEINDNSSYFDNFIPAFGGCTIRSNVGISRIYAFDQNKNLIHRFAYSDETTCVVPPTYGETQVYWIKIQTLGAVSKPTLNTMIVTKDEESVPIEFEPFKSNTNGDIYSPYSWVYADDLSEITITGE